jgi:MGT family glycosyltransferase
MGTMQTGCPHIFQAIAAAISKHKHLQLVLSIGHDVDPEKIGPFPRNAIVVRHAPQLKLLKRASICITHAGMNTVLEALAQGIPQVAIPITNDQPGIAARIAAKKTGVVASLEKLTPDYLSTLLDEALTDATYRTNSRKLQKAIAATNGLSVAASLIEKAFGMKEVGGKA